MKNSEILRSKEAAKYLDLSESALRQSRMNGKIRNRIAGPPFIRLGRAIRYMKKDLDQWLEQHRVIK